jgi:uncharacterized protein YndB with AHSA1/START domain
VPKVPPKWVAKALLPLWFGTHRLLATTTRNKKGVPEGTPMSFKLF